MNETDWAVCTDTDQMMTALRGKASERKLRLFAVACCRRIEGLFTEKSSRDAVEVATRFADGLAKVKELDSACAEAIKSFSVAGILEDEASVLRAPAWAASRPQQFHGVIFFRDLLSPEWFAGRAATDAHMAVLFDHGKRKRTKTAKQKVSRRERHHQAHLLRDIMGPNFCRPVQVEPTILGWKAGTVRKLAQGIYEENAFERLPILSDALEDAGCENPELLAHCRERGPHTRGCWAVDALLGKA